MEHVSTDTLQRQATAAFKAACARPRAPVQLLIAVWETFRRRTATEGPRDTWPRIPGETERGEAALRKLTLQALDFFQKAPGMSLDDLFAEQQMLQQEEKAGVDAVNRFRLAARPVQTPPPPKPLVAPIEGLEAAQATVAEAVTRRGEHMLKLATADAEVERARESRQRLVSTASAGRDVPNGKALAAAEVLRAAEAHASVLADALPAMEQAIATAEAGVAQVMAREADKRFETACKNRVAAAERIEHLARCLGEAVTEWQGTADELGAAWRLGRAPLPHETASLRETRRAAWTVPPALQMHIIQTGTVEHIGDFGQRERGTWGKLS